MKMIGILLLLIMILGCANTRTTNAPHAENQSHSPLHDQTFIDEKNYSGQELELVQIINKSTKSLNDRNEREYMALFAQDSPISQLNKKRLTTIEVVSFGPINDDFASVETKIRLDSGPETAKLYSFIKEDGAWKIYDID